MFSNIKNGSQTVQNRKELGPCLNYDRRVLRFSQRRLPALCPSASGLLSSELRPTRTCLASCRERCSSMRGPPGGLQCSVRLAPGPSWLSWSVVCWFSLVSLQLTHLLAWFPWTLFLLLPLFPGHSLMNDSNSISTEYLRRDW